MSSIFQRLTGEIEDIGSGCTRNSVSEEERLPIWSKLGEETSEVLSTGYYDADVWRKRRTVGERDQDSFSDENGNGDGVRVRVRAEVSQEKEAAKMRTERRFQRPMWLTGSMESLGLTGVDDSDHESLRVSKKSYSKEEPPSHNKFYIPKSPALVRHNQLYQTPTQLPPQDQKIQNNTNIPSTQKRSTSSFPAHTPSISHSLITSPQNTLQIQALSTTPCRKIPQERGRLQTRFSSNMTGICDGITVKSSVGNQHQPYMLGI